MLIRHFLLLFISVVGSYRQVQGFAPASRSSTRNSDRVLRLSPSPLEGDDGFDMQELRQRIDEEYSSFLPMIQGGGSTTKVRKSSRNNVHVVVFQAGTDNQGAHTIEYPKGSGNNVVLAFESLKACRRFAASLEQQNNFVDATPTQYRLDELQNFFSGVGVAVQVVPDGVELKPPTQNVPKFGHNPSLCQTKKYLDYLYQMKDDFEDDDEDTPSENHLSGWMWSSSESSVDHNVLHSDGAWE